ncbi:MAG: DNA internalization-related competence protein ComEC/Rec2, partial [Deltaproteobacteria bacterium]|nr:DNA internalization-related competence protein ComEC/Rec2 [Deltaproteobacteria bacterium]
MLKGFRFSAVDSLIPVTLAFCAGIAWANFAAVPLTISGIVIILLAIRLLVLHHNSTITGLILLAFFFMVGGVHATLALRPAANKNDIAAQIKQRQKVSIIGVISRSPTIRPTNTSLLIAIEQIITPKRRLRVSGLVKLSMRGLPSANLTPGDHIIALAELAPVAGYDVPGAFDYRSYLAYQGIRVSGWLSSPLLIRKVIPIPPDTLAAKLKNIPEIIRQRLGRRLDQSVPAQSGIYKALLIGDRAGLSQDILETFKACGIVHLLAISGIHMGLLALVVTLCITWLLKRSQWALFNIPISKTAAVLSLPPLILYALIAGFHPPAVRALIMVAVFIGALLVNRQWSIMNNIAIAALVILAINPALLFTASFQLSFAAIISIAIFLPTLGKIITRTPTGKDKRPKAARRFINWCLFSLLISLAAMAGTAPILIYHFNRISLISPLTTLLIEPLLCLWALIWGLIASLFLAVPTLATPLFKIGALGITMAVKLASFFAAWPVSLWLPSPTWAQIFFWFLALILSSLYLRKRRNVFIVGILISLAIFFWPAPHAPGRQTLVDILNVGHGSASILQLPGRHTFIIDGGKRQAGQSTFNAGRNLIAPFLWHQHIKSIDAIIITHPHADHYNGLFFIMKRFQPKTLWINSEDYDERGFKDLLTLARRLHIHIKIAAEKDILYQDGPVKLTVIANLYADTARTKKLSRQERDSERNNQGLVLRLEAGQRSFLFTGDIERSAEQRLIAESQPGELRADVVKVPHHGSRTSSSPDFIGAVMPRYAIISAARNGRGIFPAPEV